MKSVQYRGYTIELIKRPDDSKRALIYNTKKELVDFCDGDGFLRKPEEMAKEHIDFFIAGMPIHPPLEKVNGTSYDLGFQLATLYRNQELIYELLLKIYDKP